MALGDLVRTIFVRIKEDGADQVKAAIDDVAARAAAQSAMDPTVKIGVDTSGWAQLQALRTELAALSAGGQGSFADLANRIKLFSGQADSGNLKAAALALELRALKGAAADAEGGIDGGGGVHGGLLGGLEILSLQAANLASPVLTGLSNTFSTIAGLPWAQIGIWGGLATAASSGLLGMIPAAAAAAGGFAAFGALAYPTFSTVIGAVSTLQADTLAYKQAIGDVAKDQALHTIRQEWASLDGPQKAAVKGVQNLQSAFGQLAHAFQPSALKIFGDFLQIAHTLLPQIVPFAQTAATAIGGLLTNFEKFAQSPGFAQFRSEMLKLEGPAITTIGTAIGQIAVALGKLLTALANPQALRSFTILVDILAGAITALAVIVSQMTQAISLGFHAIASAFDYVRHQIAYDAHYVAQDFDFIRHGLATMAATFVSNLDGIVRNVQQWAGDVIRFGGQVLSWFQALPGKVAGFLSSLPSLLFQAGKNAIQGLIDGILSMAGPVASAASHILSIVRSFLPFSPALQGPLSGSGAPFNSGMRIGADLAAGIAASTAQVHAAASGLASAAAMGSPGYGAASGPQQITLQVLPGGATAFEQFMTQAIRYWVRVKGGGNVQTAFGRL